MKFFFFHYDKITYSIHFSKWFREIAMCVFKHFDKNEKCINYVLIIHHKQIYVNIYDIYYESKYKLIIQKYLWYKTYKEHTFFNIY